MVVRAANDPALNSSGATVGVTLAEQAYLNIKKDIIRGHLAPNQPLRFEYLKETYALSFSPLREALTRLQSERLVVASALRGYRVAEISISEMWDTLRTRTLIEGQALSQAIEAGDDDWEANIVATFHALSRHSKRLLVSATADEIDEMERRHRNFHLALIGACPSRWLLELSALFHLQTERYRWPTLTRRAAQTVHTDKIPADVVADKAQGLLQDMVRDVEGEHEALMQAVLGRDSQKAVALLTAHLEATGRYIERIMNKPLSSS